MCLKSFQRCSVGSACEKWLILGSKDPSVTQLVYEGIIIAMSAKSINSHNQSGMDLKHSNTTEATKAEGNGLKNKINTRGLAKDH